MCAWIGNSAPVAMEHYLQVTDADFAKASGTATEHEGDEAPQNAQQNSLQDKGNNRNASEAKRENPDDSDNHRDSLVELAPRAGLEPATLGLEIPCSIQLSYRGLNQLHAIFYVPFCNSALGFP